jgi:DNA-binding GntR family transcriptional regulator
VALVKVGSKIERRSLVDQVGEVLRREILAGEYAPNERLVIDTLALKYGVSQIPVREALRGLEGEGLVEFRAGTGTVVADVTREELGELYELRRLIEPYVLRRAVGHYDDAMLSEARELLDVLTDTTPTRDSDRWWQAHLDFHDALLRPGFTPWSERFLRLIWQSVERYQRLYALVFGDISRANHEHEALLEAAVSRDADRLIAVWISHLDEKESRVAEGLTQATAAGDQPPPGA